MSRADNIRKAIDAFNRHDAEAFAATYSPDAVVYDPYYPESLRGREAVRKDMEDFFLAFPDANVAARTIIEDDAVAALEVLVTGTHTGPLPLPSGEVPGTGRKISFQGAHFFRFNSRDQSIEDHRYYDVLGQLTQLGLLPEAESVS
jgi:steroid delta-isomerase-like uncharacterized protein